MDSPEDYKKLLAEQTDRILSALRLMSCELLEYAKRSKEEANHTGSPSLQGDLVPLKWAPETTIHQEIKKVYDEADAAGKKPPNIREVVPLVQSKLQERGFRASGRSIQRSAAPYEPRRRRPGVTVASEKRHKEA